MNYQNDGKRKTWRSKRTAQKLTASSVKHVTEEACMATNGTGALVFTDNVTAGVSSQSPDLSPAEPAFHLLNAKLRDPHTRDN